MFIYLLYYCGFRFAGRLEKSSWLIHYLSTIAIFIQVVFGFLDLRLSAFLILLFINLQRVFDGTVASNLSDFMGIFDVISFKLFFIFQFFFFISIFLVTSIYRSPGNLTACIISYARYHIF